MFAVHSTVIYGTNSAGGPVAQATGRREVITFMIVTVPDSKEEYSWRRPRVFEWMLKVAADIEVL